MADRFLIIEHGNPGSAGDLVERIQKHNPKADVEQTDPSTARRLMKGSEYDLVIVDPQHLTEEAVHSTRKLPRAMRPSNGAPVIFIIEDEELNGQKLTPGTKKMLACPWLFSSRNGVVRAIQRALHPEYERIVKRK